MDYNESEDFRKKKNRNLAWIVKLNKKPSQLSLNRK